MPTFSELPSELVELVVFYLAQVDIYAVSQVSKALHTLALPFLYRHVDLLIPPGEHVPRIDRFCFNILNDEKLAKYVQTLRVGLSPREGVHDGQRWLPRDSHVQDLLYLRASQVLQKEPLVSYGDDLREAISMRDYGGYAALVFLILPSLLRLDIADLENATIRPLHTILRGLNRPGPNSRRQASDSLRHRVSSIQEVCYNFDRKTGIQYPFDSSDVHLYQALNLPALKKLEFFIPEGMTRGLRRTLPWLPRPSHPILTGIQPTNISTIVIRHSSSASLCIRSLLENTPQLLSLTCEMWIDHNKLPNRLNIYTAWINLSDWNDALRHVRNTLTTLALSVEYYDGKVPFFKQPDVRKQVYGYLDLTTFEQLHTLEVPFPFLTGDSEFSIVTEFYPLFPPNLQYLSLRTDISRAQLPYPFDQSIMPRGPTFEESQKETYWLMGARMDISYMFQASLVMLDQCRSLRSISIWQPAYADLEWFDGQILDFTTTCKNRSVTAKIIYPLLFRWKRASHWDLVKEVTLFDPSFPERDNYSQLLRGERNGIPLGLATQYHLNEFRHGHVLIHR